MYPSTTCAFLLLCTLAGGISALDRSECVIPKLECPNNKITFWLFRKYSPTIPYQLDFSNPDTLANADFNKTLKTVFLIHGYTGSRFIPPTMDLKDQYFLKGDYNIIAIDYNPITQYPCYLESVINIPLIGNCSAQVIDELVRLGKIDLPRLHVIGLSMGAHVAGAIANWIQSGKLFRITGLDPARPLFVTTDSKRKLDPSDAKFVDVIHTNSLERALLQRSGKVDFYVNDGTNQPQCEGTTVYSSSETCSHLRSSLLFAESINTQVGFYGRKCESWTAYQLGQCEQELPKDNVETFENFGPNNSPILLTVDKNEMIMGEYTPDIAQGIYVLNTNDVSPFAKGHVRSRARLPVLTQGQQIPDFPDYEA